MACKEADISYIGEKTEKDKKTEKGEPKKKKAKVQSDAVTSTSRESSVESLLSCLDFKEMAGPLCEHRKR